MSLFIYLLAAAGATAASDEVAVPQPNQSAKPIGYATFWISNSDYPAAALAEKREGRTEFRVLINKWGVVSDCMIVKSSGHADLDDATCGFVVNRARFYPATDAEAKPIAGEYSDAVNWQLPKKPGDFGELIARPKGEVLPPVPSGNPGLWVMTSDYPPLALMLEHEGVSKFTVSVDKNGKVSKCEIRESSGFPELDKATCDAVSERATFRPATDEKGKASVGTYSNQVRWQIPQGPIAIPEDETMTTTFIIDPNGKPVGCKVKSSVTDDGKWIDCPWPIDQEFEPRRNASGQTVPVRIVSSTVIKVIEGGAKDLPKD